MPDQTQSKPAAFESGGEKQEREKLEAKPEEEPGLKAVEKIQLPDLAVEKKEQIKESIEKIGSKIQAQQGSTKKDDGKGIKEHADEISQLQDAEQQIEKLVNLAVENDPFVAIKVAKELDENYILDKVHDRLMEDEVRKILIEKGLIKND